MTQSRDTEIAILLPDLRAGGAERVCVNLANAFAEQGVAVDIVLIHEGGDLAAGVHPSIRIVSLKKRRLRGSVRALASYLSSSGAQALLANMWPLPILGLVARAISQSRVRVVGVEHTTWTRSEMFASLTLRMKVRWSMRFLYHRLDSLVAVSQGVANDLSQLSEVPRSKIDVVYNPITGGDVRAGETTQLTKEWADGEHDKILSVANLKKVKDIPTMLRAFARLRCKRNAKLLVLGEGPERASLEAMVSSLGLSDSVFFPGYAKNPRPFYEAADLFVLSSVAEGLPTVVVEALEHGVPVVCTDCPSGPREILDDGKYGALVPVGDFGLLANAMERALSVSHDRDYLKCRAGDFTVKRAADAYLEILLPGRNG